jgi:hypothetical protein
VVEAALEARGFDARGGEEGGDLRGEGGRAFAGEGGFVEVGGEAVEAGGEGLVGLAGVENKKMMEKRNRVNILVDEVGVLGVVEVNLIGLVGLPVGGKDDYGLGLDLLGDLLADGLEDRVDGVGCVVLDVGLGCVSRD